MLLYITTSTETAKRTRLRRAAMASAASISPLGRFSALRVDDDPPGTSPPGESEGTVRVGGRPGCRCGTTCTWRGSNRREVANSNSNDVMLLCTYRPSADRDRGRRGLPRGATWRPKHLELNRMEDFVTVAGEGAAGHVTVSFRQQVSGEVPTLDCRQAMYRAHGATSGLRQRSWDVF